MSVFAEGSKDLYPNGAQGNRAYLYCATEGTNTFSWPFKTVGTHYVYAKAGEEIAVASSAQGIGSGTINITAPNGVVYTSGSSKTIGCIKSRSEELAGPNDGSGPVNGRYTSFLVPVTANTEGVWKIEFLPPSGIPGNSTVSVPDQSANGSWTQGSSGNGNPNLISAWDVSVKSGGAFIIGRVFTNVLNLLISANFEKDKSYYAKHYVLTKDGRAYRVQTNGNNGVGFTFFSNSNGFANNSIPSYKSLNLSTQAELSAVTHDPRSPDQGNNVTHKIFYNKPNPDLPASASIFLTGIANAVTWLKNTAVLPKIDNIQVKGVEGTIGQVSRKGAYITFNSTTGGTYKITIPVPSGADRVIVGVATVGNNSVFWDAKDANGVFVPAGTPLSQLKTRLLSAEVHFPYIDMEINPQGLIIELTNNTLNYDLETSSLDEGVYSDRVYWDDSDISGAGTGDSSSPVNTATTGQRSNSNGHKWGRYNADGGLGHSSFGDTKSMDTWAYIQGSEESQPMTIVIKSADLMVESITPTVNTYFTDQKVSYKIRVKNDGPSDISGSTFEFKAPTGYNISSVVPTIISGTGTVSNATVSGSTYQSKVAMNNQTVIEFTVTGTVVAPLSNQPFEVEASILRPPDVTDPDATDPISAVPVDPHQECLNGSAIEGCNNIKYNIFNPQQFCIGSSIAPVSYTVASGFPDVDGYMPLGLVSNYFTATKILTVSGAPTETGLFTFTLLSPSNGRKKTTVLLLVNANPTITVQPSDITICEGANSSTTVVSSASTDTYKWQYEGSSGWVDFVAANGVSGFGTATLTITNAPLALDKVKIRVIVSSAAGCATVSDVKTITIHPLPEAPSVTASGATIFCDGESVVLSTTATGSYQWYLNGSAIANATAQTYEAKVAGKYTVVVTNASNCASPVSNEITVTVNTVPVAPVVTANGGTIFCDGESVVLSTTVTGSYQWYLNGSAITNATGQTYEAKVGGKYTVVVTNASNCASPVSNEVTVTVNTVPVAPVVTAGGATIFCDGESVVLSTTATGSYQWYLNGSVIINATGQSYEAKVAGKYTVVVTNASNCASPVSNEVTVTVNTLPTQPVVTAGSATIFCDGESVVLSTTAIGNYQWYLNGSAITNATTQTYEAKVAGKYTVVVTNASNCASPVSNEVTVTVNTLPNQPVVTAGGATIFCDGESVVLSTTATGSYQWYLNGSAITNATTQTYEAKVAGKYTVVVTNASNCASPVSNEITVTVNTVPVAPIVTAGGATIFCDGESVVLSTTATGSYQWYLNGSAITNATGQTYEAKVAGKYTVVVTNASNCASPVSNEVTVTVNTLPTQPVVTAAGATIFCDGESVVLSTTATGSYQWYLNGSAITNATGQTYEAKVAGKYTVVVTNASNCASPVSNEITVTVNTVPVAPVVTANGGTIFCDGESVVLSTTATGSYQWYLNGTAITNATGQSYEAKVAGKYTLVVTNASNCASPVSNEVMVTVNTIPVAPIVTAGSATIFCDGESVVLSTTAIGNYQWYLNGTAITNATGQSYEAKVAGKYTVVVTNASNCASPVSNEVTVTVNTLPTQPVVTAGGATIFCDGESVVLSTTATGSYQWYLNGSAITNATTQTYEAKVAGKYTVVVTNASNCASPVSNEVTVTVNNLPTQPVVTAGGATIFCDGESVVLSTTAIGSYQWYLNGSAITNATAQTYEAKIAGKYTVVVTNASNCASPVSNEITVTVNTVPVAPVVTAGGATIFCDGESVVLSTTAIGNYQWYLNGTAITNATTQTYEAKVAGKYTVVVTNASNCASPVSNEITVTVNTVPVAPVVTAGGATIFCDGESVVLSTTATGSYQWYLNGSAITTATGQTYEAKVAGKYTVVVTNASNCASPVSNEVMVTVNTIPVAPVVTAGSATIFCDGESVVLSTTAIGNYQWYLNGTAITNATGQSYEAKVAGKYTVVVTNASNCASPVSNEVTVTVNTVPVAPVVTAGSATIFCDGESVVLSTTATGSYQWYLNGSAITNATGQSYEAKVAGKYTVVVTNASNCASPVSNEVTVTVNTVPVAPVVTAGSATIFCDGESVVLSTTATGSYQWYLNGSAITNATAQTYEAKVAGKYTVVVTNASNCASPVSNEVTVTVNTVPVAPVVTAGGATIFCDGESVVLSTTATGSYQWYLNGSAITNATTQTYEAKVAGKYTVVVTNASNCASPVSNEITVTVNTVPVAPVVTAGGATIFCDGESVVLSTTATGSYQWYLNGSAITTATGQTYEAKVAGKYTVVVTNASNCASPVSNEVTVTVNNLPTQPVVTAGGATIFCDGESVVLSTTATGSYQWYLNGSAITNATGQTYEAKVAGKYTVVVTNASNCASPVSNEVTVTVNTLPTQPVVTAGGATIFCDGESVVLSTTATGSYQWYLNGSVITNATGQTYEAKVAGKYTVVVTNASNCASPVSNEVTVTVNTLPIQPVVTAAGATIFCDGESVVLSTTATGSYQWYLNGSAITNATAQTYEAKIAGKYTVVVTNASNCASPVSNEVTVTVNTLPTQPVVTAGGATIFCDGESVVLSTTATGSYQWYLNGSVITNATGQTYEAKVAGKYTVVVTNASNCASPVSNEVTVTVNTLPIQPVVTAAGATIFCDGESVVLSTTATGSYQWYLNGSAITNATAQTYEAKIAGKYTVVVTNASNCASPVSNEVTVTVNTVPVAPVVTAGSATIFCDGESVVLSTTATGSYQWYLNGSAITNATTQTYEAKVAGKYTVVVTNASNCASPVSNEITVTVNTVPVAPVVTAGGATIFCDGESVVLSTTATGSYQWYLNGSAITNATGQTYEAKVAGKYTVVVTNASNCASPVSNEVTVTVNTVPVAPVVTAGSATIFCDGESVVLSTTATGSYQWYLNGSAITNATGQTYEAKVGGKYTVVVTNASNCASPVSNEVTVTVNTIPVAPVVTAGGATIFCDGESVVLSTTATGSYQWYLNGSAITNATGQSYEAKVGGKYTVVVTNASNCASPVSNEVTVTVNTVPVAPVVTAGGATMFCDGESVVLSTTATGSYQWYLNGSAITNATGQTYEAKVAGKYTVVVTNASNCASPVSNEVTVTVNTVPVAPVVTAGGATIFCDGESVVLSTTATGSYQWYLNGSAITNATGQSYEAKVGGKYTLVVTNASNCASPVSNEVTVTVNTVPVAPVVTAGGATIFCDGESVVLSTTAIGSYQWYLNGSAITNATAQTYEAKIAGKYTVVVTNASNCASPVSNEVTVTVNTVPVAPVVTAGSATIFCDGESVVLSTTAIGSYQWYLNGSAITNATGQSYEAKVAGKYTLVVTNASNCASPVSNEVTVTVNTLPTQPVVTAGGVTIFCDGESVVLSTTATGSYQWYLNGSAITNATGQTYEAKVAGKYTVVVTNASNCASPVSNEITITVNALPIIPTITAMGNTVFCIGNSVALSSSTASGYQWYKNGAIIPGASGKTYIATETGSYHVVVTNVNGCSSSPSLPTQVTASPYPELPNISPAGATTFCEGGVVTLTSSSSAGNQWYKNGILIPGANGQTLGVNEIGNYAVKVTNQAGCASTISAATNVTVNKVPKGFDDVVNSLSCAQSSFSYNLQTKNVNNIQKGGNAVPAGFTWTVNSTVQGAVNGSGKVLNATLINTTTTEQYVVYLVTPIAEAGGCAGQPFKITVRVPVCLDIAITKSANRTNVSAPGDEIKYSIIVSNNGNANHSHVKVNDPLLGGLLHRSAGDNGNDILEKGESWIYSGTYTITQNNIDAFGLPDVNTGKIVNTATVSSVEYPQSKSAIAEVDIDANPSVALVKTGAMNRDFRTMTYTFTVTNNGNMTLYNLVVKDPKIIQPIVLSQTTLAPGATTSGIAQYTITNPEKVAGTVNNTATVTGLTKSGTPVTDVSGTAVNNDEPTVIDITRYPIAIDDYANTKADIEVAVPVINNDKPALFPLDAATLEVKSQPTNGKLSVNKDGKVVYMPNKGFFGIEKFTYKVDDSNGLGSNVAIVTITVVPPDLDVPNTFTPNGDGKNDTFVITGLENYEGVSLFVYNRWGDEVYRNNNYKNEWDGNGLNDGTYFYVLKLKKAGKEESRRSWILIKR
ncbi:DUF7507 domain-containing protein [Pedobacter africanus]|uniref:Gliding motility-associated-like protein/uncharacterized repeat protein (TIGR01451 family) n=1 Tax=Pedobacter africanus TaxID=151894 RepID=A0ACC6KQN8_9SPHI|nr:gliding motility-associated C-terminal domain-containing protein [Pedobacter africanus]MDR6781660.1 gliding motility-associated-like protein/uncharacterized repeat protein (TIGR01451 family) [Pedobacter africanus]